MSEASSPPPARARLQRAVKAVESVSAAEVAVVVRARADPHHAVEWIAGTLLAYLVLAFMLFAPPVFALPWIAVDTVLACAVGIAIVRAWPGAKRALLSTQTRESTALRAARATFVELGIDRTRDRTGILVYVAALERQVVVVPDRGITAAVPAESWEKLRAALVAAAPARVVAEADVERLAVAIEALADPLAGVLPRKHDDVDELEDVA